MGFWGPRKTHWKASRFVINSLGNYCIISSNSLIFFASIVAHWNFSLAFSIISVSLTLFVLKSGRTKAKINVIPKEKVQIVATRIDAVLNLIYCERLSHSILNSFPPQMDIIKKSNTITTNTLIIRDFCSFPSSISFWMEKYASFFVFMIMLFMF